MPFQRRILIVVSLTICTFVQVEFARGLDLVGYVPYWEMSGSYANGTLPAQLAMLNEVRYFGLTAASDGTITPLSGSGTLQSHLDRVSTIVQKINALPAGQRPRLDLTLGGAGEAANFATIAASPTLRTTFAQNISAILNQTGATSVDIDWEHPQGTTQFNNYGSMLQTIKQQVGSANRVYATIDPTIRVPLSVFSGPNAIDGISLMTYELGWWANDPADPNRGEHSLPQYVTDSVDDWTNAPGTPNRRPWVFAQWGLGAQPQDLGIGLPFFGRVIGTSQAPTAGTPYSYRELVAGGVPDTSGNYYSYQGQTVWVPGPSLAAQRVQFAHDRGLDHMIIWELGHDVAPTNANSLLRTAFLKNETLGGDFDGDRDVDSADYDVFRATFGATSDLRADGNGDGVINTADYIVWRNNATGSGASLSGIVPEPASGGLLATILTFISCIRRPLRC